jgi:uncharacterized protein YecA (UPF0149 family)
MEEVERSKYTKPIEERNLTEVQIQNLRMFGGIKIGRNDICPCGSGIKFKKCCLKGVYCGV